MYADAEDRRQQTAHHPINRFTSRKVAHCYFAPNTGHKVISGDTRMQYLTDTWYAAAFSHEVTRTPLVRTLLERPIVLFRTESGQAVALNDRCPHRFAPLHEGKVIADAIRCPYHGLQFGPNGACVHNPIGDGKIPKAAVTTAYPLVDVDGVLWIWMGREAPDTAAILRWPEFTDVGHFSTVEGYVHMNAEYRLVSDNLLDLSHAEFLHPNLATEGFNRRTQFAMEQHENTVCARNWRPNEPITPSFAMAFGDDAPTHVDHRSIVRWQPPSNLHLEIGATRVGRPKEEGVTTIAAHLITPETATTCHYFWKLARDYHIDDREFDEQLRSLVQSAFETEDKPMIEAQYRYMAGASFETLNPVLLSSDAASVRARRILTQLLADATGLQS